MLRRDLPAGAGRHRWPGRSPRPSPRSSAGLAESSTTTPSPASIAITPGRDYDSQGQGLRPVGRADLRLRRRRADLDHRLSLQQIYARHGRRLQQSRHPLSRQRRRLVQPLQDLHAKSSGCRAMRSATSSTGWSAAITRTRSSRSTTTLPTATIMRATAIAWSPRTSRRGGADHPCAGCSPTCFNTAVATGVRSALVAHTMLRWRRSVHDCGQYRVRTSRRSAPLRGSTTRRRPAFRSPLRRSTSARPPFGNSGFTNLAIALGGPASSARRSMAQRLTTPIVRPATTGRCSRTTSSRSPTG